MITLVVHGARDQAALARTLASIKNLASYAPDRFVVFVTETPVPADGANEAERLRVPVSTVDAAGLARVLDEAEGHVVEVDAGTVYSTSAFDRYFEHADAGVLQRMYVHAEGAYKYRLNRATRQGGDTARISIDEPEHLWAGSTPLVIEAALLRELRAAGRAPEDRNLRFAEALLATRGFGVLSGRVRSTGRHEDELYGEQRLFSADWYLGFAEAWAALLDRVAAEEGAVPVYLQRLFLYLAQYRMHYNVDRRNKNALDAPQLESFSAGLTRGLGHVDASEIVAPLRGAFSMSRVLISRFLRLKLGEDYAPEIAHEGNDLAVTVGDHVIERLSRLNIRIDVMDYLDDELVVRGVFRPLHLQSRVTLHVAAGGFSAELPDTGIYSETSYFGRVVNRYPTFTARIPREALESADRIEFIARDTLTGAHSPVLLDFRKTNGRLSAKPGAYWAAGPVILRAESHGLPVQRRTAWTRLRAELDLQKRLLGGGDRVARSAGILRLLYFITRPFMRGRHWIYYDRVVRGGDNGEYAYTYAASRTGDGISKHYVLSAEAPDAARFRAEGKRFLAHKTLKHRLLFLNAELVFATHLKPVTRNGFSWNEEYFRDLFSYRVVYLNHGLVLDRLDYVLNKHAENADRMCVVSGLERRALSDPTYGFAPEEIVETGFARYDGLISRPKRQLLLAPTWRYYLNRPQKDDTLQERNDEFRESAYFKVFNGLINNARLVAAAEETGYDIVYLLHPNTSSQIDDFSASSPRVKLLAPSENVSYEQVLTESALMITDYSGVQFDFAHMNKPVVYYHHPSIPPHYQADTFSYEEHGFGEITCDEEHLVDLLIDYMRSDCALREEYRDRIEAFFTHHDLENGRRVYDVGVELTTR